MFHNKIVEGRFRKIKERNFNRFMSVMQKEHHNFFSYDLDINKLIYLKIKHIYIKFYGIVTEMLRPYVDQKFKTDRRIKRLRC